MMIKSILSILLAAFLQTSCINEDLSSCPPDEYEAAVCLTYLCKDEAGGDEAYRTIRRADFYIFDLNNRFVCSTTESIGSFTKDRTYYIPLPAGTYRIVSWVNLNEALLITPNKFIPGVTTLEECNLTLADLTRQQVAKTPASTTGTPIPVFYGTTEIMVEENQITHAEIPLLRNTKDIRLSVRFIKPDGTPCEEEDPSHRYAPIIRCFDGSLSFDNFTLPGYNFYCLATERESHKGENFDALFHKMKLQLNQQAEIMLVAASGIENDKSTSSVFYRENLLKLLVGTGYSTQEALNRTQSYNILLQFVCGTTISVRIWINGWEYVDINGGL